MHASSEAWTWRRGAPPARRANAGLRPRGRDRGARADKTDSCRLMLSFVLLLLIVTLDVTKSLDRGSAVRYIVLFVPIGAWALIRARRRMGLLIRRPIPADRVLMVLAAIGLTGSVYGRVFLQTGSTALPIFIPMLIAFLYLGVLDEPRETEVHRIVVAIATVGFVYVCLSAVANSGIVPLLKASRAYRNADAMFIPMGAVALLALRKRAALVMYSIIVVFVFFTYPSATIVAVLLSAALSLFITRPSASAGRPWFVAFGVVLVVSVALLNFGTTIGLADEYFAAVGKRNNSNTRLALWRAGLDKFEASPLYGDLFTGETTVTVARNASGGALFKNPYNDDYILFAASGGLLCLGLLVAWIVLTDVTVFRRYRLLLARGDPVRAALLRTLFVAFNAWLVAAAFNPLFQGTGRSVSLFSVYALMMLVGRPKRAMRSAVAVQARSASGSRPSFPAPMYP
jgi:hypothetical protein